MSALEIFARGFLQNRGSEWAEHLAMLDALIQNIFHFGPAWVGQNATVAERARTPFRAALVPAKNFAVSQFAGCCVNRGIFLQFLNFNSIVSGRTFLNCLRYLPS